MSPDGDRIPARSLPLAARAPAKCVLFGEHAVVHGGPEVVAAIDLYAQLGVRNGAVPSLNGRRDELEANGYLREGLARFWPFGTPLELTVTSRIPRSAGLGSSGALCAAFAAALGAVGGGLERSALAERAFAIERGAQGVGSPGDTSSSVAGGLVALNVPNGTLLWEVGDGSRSWSVRRVPDPGWAWIVAYSGVPRNTAETVRAVGRRLAESDGPSLLERFRSVAIDGLAALAAEDREATGRALAENQGLLREIGVSHPKIESLLEAAAPAILGGKLTGAGAGGSIVVLPIPGREVEAARRIARAGGTPYTVRVAPSGAHLVEPEPPAAEISLSGDDPDDGAGS